MDEQNIDVLDALTNQNIGNIKLLNENLFEIEMKLKQVMDQGVSPDDFLGFDALYKATVEARDLLNSFEV